MVGGSGGKVVARLAADGTVYTTSAIKNQFTNLVNYKIKTEGDFLKRKALNTQSAATTVVDLGKQLLQFARDNDVEGVRNAIARGAPYAHDWLGLTALHFAAMNDQYDICEILLNGGINKDAKTKVDRTPLHFACYYGHYKIVQLLLSRHCQVNPRDMLLMTPLHWSVQKGFKPIVRLLLNYNADVTVVSKFDKTPIALAVLSEQADILQELENVRQTQITRKMNEEIKKETSEAVNSIMNLCNDITEQDIFCEVLEGATDDSTEATIINLQNLKETHKMTNSINLLESHGISMLPSNDDESKNLLNTALKHGRQLILSEGGKLLLNETKRSSNLIKSLNLQNLNNLHNNHNNNNINSKSNNQNNLITKLCLKPTTVTLPTTTSALATNVPLSQNNNKIRSNILMKKSKTTTTIQQPAAALTTTTTTTSFCKNKNIRLMSLTDFKKICGNTNLKPVQSLSLGVTDTHKNAQISNLRDMQQAKLQNTNIIELKPFNDSSDSTELSADGKPKLKRPSAANVRYYPAKLANTNTNASANTTVNNVQMRLRHTPFQIQQFKTIAVATTTAGSQSATTTIHTSANNAFNVTTQRANSSSSNSSNNNNNNTNDIENNMLLNSKTTVLSATTTTAVAAATTNVTPAALTTSQMCRQLQDLRKQHEELRRNFDIAQKEKEELRQRVERLEEYLLVEKTDAYTTS